MLTITYCNLVHEIYGVVSLQTEELVVSGIDIPGIAFREHKKWHSISYRLYHLFNSFRATNEINRPEIYICCLTSLISDNKYFYRLSTV